MRRYLDFLMAEDGAVTVDWVVLCAAVVAIGVAISLSTYDAVTTDIAKLGSRVDSKLSEIE